MNTINISSNILFMSKFKLHWRLTRRLAAIALAFSSYAFGQSPTAPHNIIEVELARHVATEHVHANNQPYQWRHLNHMVLHDIDGNPNAYAFIFAKSESRFKEPADLKQHIASATARALAKQEEPAQPNVNEDATVENDDNDPFAFDNLATVITGATADSPLILRHFRGAPEFWVEAARMEASASSGKGGLGKRVKHVVMITPMDFRLVTTDGGDGVVSKPEAKIATKATLADAEEVVSVHSKRTERISALRQQRAKREDRERGRRATMNPEDRRRYQDALAERAAFLVAGWEEKRSELIGNKDEEVGQ